LGNETLSTIITTHNRAKKVPGSILSVLRQTRPADEILVVDDGSQDNTQEVLKTFSDRINIVKQTNRGYGAARNEGLKRATGSYIAFQDDDDEWYPWKLEVQLKIMNAMPEVAMLCTDVDGQGEKGKAPRLVTKEFFNRFEKQFGLTKSDIFPNSIKLVDLGITHSAIDPLTKLYYGLIFEHMWVKLFILNSTVLWRKEKVIPFPPEVSVGTDTLHYVERSKVCVFAFLDVPTITYSIYDSDQHISNKLIDHFGGIVRALHIHYGWGNSLSPHLRSSYRKQLSYYFHRIARENLLGFNREIALENATCSIRAKWNQIPAYLILLLLLTPKTLWKQILKFWE